MHENGHTAAEREGITCPSESHVGRMRWDSKSHEEVLREQRREPPGFALTANVNHKKGQMMVTKSWEQEYEKIKTRRPDEHQNQTIYWSLFTASLPNVADETRESSIVCSLLWCPLLLPGLASRVGMSCTGFFCGKTSHLSLTRNQCKSTIQDSELFHRWDEVSVRVERIAISSAIFDSE